jgi:hypothetical protein
VERVTPVTVLPGIRVLVDDDLASSIAKWAELNAATPFLEWKAEQHDDDRNAAVRPPVSDTGGSALEEQ